MSSEYPPPSTGFTTSHAPFTPARRERQTRGRNTSVDMSSDEEDFRQDDKAMAIGKPPLKAYTWEEKEAKGFALSVLDSPTRLMMHAHSNNDSLPSQRCKFWAMLTGIKDDRPLRKPENTNSKE